MPGNEITKGFKRNAVAHVVDKGCVVSKIDERRPWGFEELLIDEGINRRFPDLSPFGL